MLYISVTIPKLISFALAMKLATTQQMRELDRRTIEELQVPGMVLMEIAGRGTVEYLEKAVEKVTGKHVVIFVGPGNNGGDGLVIARTVFNRGAVPHIFFLVDPDELTGDAGHNFSIIKHWGIHYTVVDTADTVHAAQKTILALHNEKPIHSIVDAVFGTGLCRDVRGHFFDALTLINTLRQNYQFFVVSADIPSGMHSDTGQILGGAVRADLTVTYGLPKPGHVHHGGEGIGQLKTVDIGIPPFLLDPVGVTGFALDETTLPQIREKSTTGHKGSNGHLLVLAGSTGKTGAAILSARGSMHSGCGLVTLCVPQDLNQVFETSLIEAMTVPLPGSNTAISIKDYQQITELCKGKNALVIGPGMGMEPETVELVLRLYKECSLPQVLDADAITILADHPECLAHPAGPRIFTPHPGEMARLINTTIPAIQLDRLHAAQWAETMEDMEHDFPIITVLKGAGTVIASNQGQWCINTSGNPGMGTGGMGDVLSGIIGSLLAQGYNPWEAACIAVYIHGVSGDLLAKKQPYGFSASQVALALPQAIGHILHLPKKSSVH